MNTFESGKGVGEELELSFVLRRRSYLSIGILPLINGLPRLEEMWNADV
jgi:hypothetical protein